MRWAWWCVATTLAVLHSSTADDGVSWMRVEKDDEVRWIESVSYHHYGPRSSSINASAVWLDGKDVCNLPSSGLEGLVVVTDGMDCFKIAVRLASSPLFAAT